jgi:predicted aspartyl protease
MFLIGGTQDGANPWRDKAVEAIRTARADPTSDKLQAALEAAYRADDWQGGLELSRLAVDKRPNDAELRPFAIRALWRAGEIGEAERLIADVAVGQADAEAAATVIQIELARGNLDAGKAAMERLAALGPKTANQANQLLFAKITLNQPDGVAALAQLAKKLCDPANGYPDTLLADSLVGLPELLAKVGEEPLNVIKSYGSAEMPPIYGIGLPACMAYVNGKGPYRFVVDTGGSISLSVDSDVAQEIGLKSLAESTIRGVGGAQDASLALTDELTIGGIRLERVLTHTFDMPAILDGMVAGVLGTGVLGGGRFTLDMAEGRLTVSESSAAAASGQPLDLRLVADAKLTCLVVIDGHAAVALIDSGADAIALSPAFAAELHPGREFLSMPMTAAAGVGEGDAGGMLMVPGVELKIGGRTFEDFGGLALSTLDGLLSPIIGTQFDILLGMPMLRATRTFTIDGPRCQGWVQWLE